jgi:cell division protein FtsI/penicillin-binding protein 2
MLRGPDTRLRLVTALLVAFTSVLVVQLIRLQVLEHKVHAQNADLLVNRAYQLPDPPWGVITDRNGDLLVGNQPVYKVDAQVDLVTDVTRTSNVLAPILGKSPEEIARTLTLTEDDRAQMAEHAYYSTWRQLTATLREDGKVALEAKIKKEGWTWLTISESWERSYPEGPLAGHLLGFVNQDGEGFGLEAYQQRFLRPQPVEASGESMEGIIPMPEAWLEEPMRSYPGTDIRLTIDRTIQAFIEDELDRALVTYQASGGTILVMNPETGAILASASRPNYKPGVYETYWEAGNSEVFRDPMVSVDYEPGSVFKVLTVAAALDSGSVDSSWSYVDDGPYEYGGILVNNAIHNNHGRQDLQGVLDHSLNTGVARLTTQQMGADVFYEYVRRFNLGQKTRIGLKNEEAGIVHLPYDYQWSDSYLATNAYGQGISTTPLQLAAAISSIANDGVMMYPYVVAERRYADGRVVPASVREMKRPISAETANTVAAMMQHVVDHEIEAARVPGYPVAGKTGTAQIPVTGGYDLEEVITSFVGFGPMPDPKVLILVKLEKPQVSPEIRWGTTTAAPVFGTVAARVFRLLGIPPVDAQLE